MNTQPSPPASQIGNLVRKLRDQTLVLLQQEVTLATTELSEKASRMAGNAVQLSLGALVAYAGGIILLLGLADLVRILLLRAGLAVETATWLSRVAVGGLVGVVGWGLLVKAKKSISAESVIPQKTADSLSEDKAWVQQKI